MFSLLADFFPSSMRIYVSTLTGIGMSAGVSFGQLLAGLLAPVYGWRLPFLLIAFPALMCALIVVLTIEEPSRGSQVSFLSVLLLYSLKAWKMSMNRT